MGRIIEIVDDLKEAPITDVISALEKAAQEGCVTVKMINVPYGHETRTVLIAEPAVVINWDSKVGRALAESADGVDPNWEVTP